MTKKVTINIFELADRNAGPLEKKFASLVTGCDKKKLPLIDNFAKQVQKDWKLSINMKDRPLGIS